MAVEHCTIGPDEAGMRLDRWFKSHYPALTQGGLQKLLRKGQVRVDGGRVKANMRLDAGQVVRVPPMDKAAAKPGKTEQILSPEDRDFMKSLVVYQDDAVIALNKPPGLAVQGGSGTKRHIDGLAHALQFAAPERPRLVHRLDRDTSGVLLLARTREAARNLSRAFQTHDIEKTYWAVVSGVPRPGAGTIDIDLAKKTSRGLEKMQPTDPGQADARRAVTDYAVIAEAGRKFSWLALRPRSGRTHQLRVHMAAIDHPIIGDHKYGGERSDARGILVPGLHLHARRLDVPHPVDRTRRLSLEADLPDHMTRNFATLEFDPRDEREKSLPWEEDA